VTLLEKGLGLSSILDEPHGGVLSIGPVKQIIYDNDKELLEVVRQVAFNYAQAKTSRIEP